MKKPTQEIERIRGFISLSCAWKGQKSFDDVRAILAYLDSQEWPADLTRERLEELAKFWYGAQASNPTIDGAVDALRRLAAIAPKREKRKVTLYEFLGHGDGDRAYGDIVAVKDDQPSPQNAFPWRELGTFEVDA